MRQTECKRRERFSVCKSNRMNLNGTYILVHIIHMCVYTLCRCRCCCCRRRRRFFYMDDCGACSPHYYVVQHIEPNQTIGVCASVFFGLCARHGICVCLSVSTECRVVRRILSLGYCSIYFPPKKKSEEEEEEVAKKRLRQDNKSM